MGMPLHVAAQLFNIQRRMLEQFALGEPLSAVLTTLCHEVEAWFDWPARCSVLLVDKDVLRAGAAPSLPKSFAEEVDGQPLGPMAGMCGTAAYRREKIVVFDTSTHPLWADFGDFVRKYDFAAAWSFPIIDPRVKDAIATVAVYARQPREPTAVELSFLEGLVEISGLIIHRVELERRLSEETLKLNHLLAGTDIGMWEWDSSAQHLELNDQALRLIGYEREEYERAVPPGSDEFVHPEDREAMHAAIGAHLRGDAEYFEVEFRLRHRQGHWIWVLNRGRTLKRGDQGVSFLVGTLTDVTKRKRDERRLQTVDRLESLGRLAGGIAHDFNNIMVGIFGSLSLARETIEADHPAMEDIEIAEESLERARLLTGQLLTFAKGGEPVKKVVDLERLVGDVARFDLSGSGVKASVDVEAGLWKTSADAGQLQQVFSNLFINARDAMQERGVLDISLRNVEADDPGELEQGRYVQVRVKDHGRGMSPEVQGRIFDPYFSTKETGSGLGLATVHSVVAKHGGSVSVETAVGEGTTFIVNLPALAETSRQPARGTPHIPLRTVEADQPLRILLMDDDPVVLKTCRKMVEQLCHTVQTCTCGDEAIELFVAASAGDEPFSAVILDLTIPGGMGGRETAERLAEIDSSAPLIASSGYAADPVLANFEDYGFVAIVPKPYTLHELDEALHNATSAGEAG